MKERSTDLPTIYSIVNGIVEGETGRSEVYEAVNVGCSRIGRIDSIF